MSEQSPTLVTENVPAICMVNDTSNAAIDVDVSGTILAGGGFAADCVGALCARDYKGPCADDVESGKLICVAT